MNSTSRILTFIDVSRNSSSHYIINEDDEVILCNTRPRPEGGIGSPLAITLPRAKRHEGRVLVIKDAGAYCAVNNITLQRQGGDLIEGGNTHLLLTQPSSFKKLISDGDSWWYEIG
mgnify:CR=1 FL=1